MFLTWTHQVMHKLNQLCCLKNIILTKTISQQYATMNLLWRSWTNWLLMNHRSNGWGTLIYPSIHRQTLSYRTSQPTQLTVWWVDSPKNNCYREGAQGVSLLYCIKTTTNISKNNCKSKAKVKTTACGSSGVAYLMPRFMSMSVPV